MAIGNWGGSAAGGGVSFQAKVSALCMVHIARAVPLGWCDSVSDVPVSLSAETAGAGDDIGLQLIAGGELEIQAKQKLRANDELWDSILKLCHGANDKGSFYGVLAVGPSTSGKIREHLARDVIRLGQGRNDDLSNLGKTLESKLNAARIPLNVCSRIRIQTIHVLEQDGASTQAALAHLSHITTSPDAAWSRLGEESLRLIHLRGRCDASTLSGIIPGLKVDSVGPAIIASKLLEWTLNTTREFTIPAVPSVFSLDDDWLEMAAIARDKPYYGMGSIEDALSSYHDEQHRRNGNRQDKKYNAEALGYFVRQCVVVAGPGMGKTLLLRKIARLLAKKREPVLIIRLRQLAERMRIGDTFVEGVMSIGLDAFSKSPSDVLSLGLQNLTILLDGLDESGAEQEVIARGAVSLAASFPRCRIVIATRPIGYETALLSNWKHYELVPLESSQASEHVTRLIAASPESSDDDVKKACAAATAHLRGYGENRFAARSPLLIALLASLALNKVVAEDTREGLYGQMFKLITRLSARQSDSNSLPQTVLNAFLERIGWELTAHPYADIEQTLFACSKYLAEELGERTLKARSMCDQALEFWEATGFVERVRFKASEALTFVHKTFGEFAGAQYLLSLKPRERRGLLAEIVHSEKWDEVAIFAASLGMAEELVSCALDYSSYGLGKTIQALRWASYSRDGFDPVIEQALLQRSWPIIEGPHSGQALKVGVELINAASKLAGGTDIALRNSNHLQWWTALVAWACLARSRPAALDFSGLLTFCDSYLRIADTRRINGGIELNSPVRQLWEQLLLAAAREAVRRGMGAQEQKLIDRISDSVSTQSMGFFGKLSYILSDAGIILKSPMQESMVSKLFDVEYLDKTCLNMLSLLEAVAGNLPESTILVDPPLLHLSAFFQSTDFLNLEISAVTAVDASASEATQKILALAGQVLAQDHSLLIAEVQAKIKELKTGDSFSVYSGIVDVDTTVQWENGRVGDIGDLVALCIQHPSRWIVQLAANLAEHHCSPETMSRLIPLALQTASGDGLAATAYLANSFLGQERARELVMERLRAPLVDGCKYLYAYLSTVWDLELDSEVLSLVRQGFFYGPYTADACLELVLVCTPQQRRSMLPLLKEVFKYWVSAEGAYPVGSGVIPHSPRGAILEFLIGYDSLTIDELYLAAQERRSEVSIPSSKAIEKLLLSSEAARAELLERIDNGEQLHKVLAGSLRSTVPYSDDHVRVITQFLGSSKAEVRHAALGVLAPPYLRSDEIRHWCEKLVADPYQQIRDKAHELLSAFSK